MTSRSVGIRIPTVGFAQTLDSVPRGAGLCRLSRHRGLDPTAFAADSSHDSPGGLTARICIPGSTQNSLLSGSSIDHVILEASGDRCAEVRQAPDSVLERADWTQIEVHRFLALFGSGTRLNHMFGPPQPGASTKARSAVESSSTLEPSAAAERRDGHRVVTVERHELDVAGGHGDTLGRRTGALHRITRCVLSAGAASMAA